MLAKSIFKLRQYDLLTFQCSMSIRLSNFQMIYFCFVLMNSFWDPGQIRPSQNLFLPPILISDDFAASWPTRVYSTYLIWKIKSVSVWKQKPNTIAWHFKLCYVGSKYPISYHTETFVKKEGSALYFCVCFHDLLSMLSNNALEIRGMVIDGFQPSAFVPILY